MQTDPLSSTSSANAATASLSDDLATGEIGEMLEFLQLIDTLPTELRADFYRALGRLVDGFERRQRILGYIQESLGQMNLDLKYLIFDLEATRRERDEYRRRLEFPAV